MLRRIAAVLALLLLAAAPAFGQAGYVQIHGWDYSTNAAVRLSAVSNALAVREQGGLDIVKYPDCINATLSGLAPGSKVVSAPLDTRGWIQGNLEFYCLPATGTSSIEVYALSVRPSYLNIADSVSSFPVAMIRPVASTAGNIVLADSAGAWNPVLPNLDDGSTSFNKSLAVPGEIVLVINPNDVRRGRSIPLMVRDVSLLGPYTVIGVRPLTSRTGAGAAVDSTTVRKFRCNLVRVR